MAVKVMVAPAIANGGVEKSARLARRAPDAQPSKPKRRRSSVYDADGNEVFITLMCLKCHKMRPLSQFGLRKMADGAIRNQPWCRTCRSAAGTERPARRGAAETVESPRLQPPSRRSHPRRARRPPTRLRSRRRSLRSAARAPSPQRWPPRSPPVCGAESHPQSKHRAGGSGRAPLAHARSGVRRRAHANRRTIPADPALLRPADSGGSANGCDR